MVVTAERSPAVRVPEQSNGASSPKLFAGRFRALRLLQQGQGIETWLAKDLSTGESAVVKTAPCNTLSVGARMRLEHEAGVLRQISSSRIAPLLHIGEEDNQIFLAMGFVPGLTLEDRLKEGALSVPDAIELGRLLMEALQEVHSHGVLHRDLKPANVIVDESGPLERVVLIDFGLARSGRLDVSLRNQPVGTARYMSPELAGLLDQDPDERSDLYSAGVILFECLAGRPPFPGNNLGEVLRQHLTVRAPELRSLGLAVPRVLDEILQRLLRKDPRDRYQSAEAVAADLGLFSLELKRGVAEPALVVGLVDKRRTLTEPAFVGREEELAVLDAQLDDARRGDGALICLEAESGGGKTRLLQELGQRSARQGAWVFRGEGLDQAAQRPFQLLSGVAAELVRAAAEEATLAVGLRQRLGDQAPAVAAVFPELAELLDTPAAEKLGPESFGQARSVQALATLLEALGSAERPALVLLDDCQWADELTVKLLLQWQRRREQQKGQARHGILVVAFRADEVPAGHALRGLAPAVHLKLPRFGAQDVDRLAESMAGPLPREALEVIERLSEGSPFMAAAVLQGLVEAGALVAEAGGWRAEPLALADVQSSRHAATFLARRIALLPTEVRDFLTAAAVLGKDFDLDFAAHLAAQSPVQAVAALDDARRRHLVWAKDQDTHCQFTHDKIRQTLLERLGPADRQKLHRQAALYLERIDLSRVFELAYHFDAAGESGRALPYALAAAKQARARHSLEIAEQQYRIAARGIPETDQTARFQVAQGLGDVLMLRGRYEAAATEFEVARGLAEGNAPQAQIEGKLGELAFKRGDVRTAEERIERALRLLGRLVPRRWLTFLLLALWEVWVQVLHTFFPRRFLARRSLDGAGTELLALRLYSRLAHLYWFHRGTVACLWAHLRELNRAERFPPTLELAQAYSEHAPVMSLLARFPRGIAYAEKSLAIRRDLGDLWGQGQSLHFYGVVLYAVSRFQDCIDKCREAVRLLERTGDYWEVNIARYQIAASLYRLGDLRGAVAEAQRMHQSGIELGDAQASGISLDTWARAALGKVPAEIIQAELDRPSDEVQRKGQVLAAEGTRLLFAGKPGEAAAVFERGRQLVQKAGVKNAWVSPLWPWLATALRLELERATPFDPAQRKALLRRSKRAARQALRLARSFQNELPHALRENALTAALRGKAKLARRFFDEGLAAAERQGARYEHAQTLLARGQVGRALGWPEAQADIARAEQELGLLEGSAAETKEPVEVVEKPLTLALADRFDTLLDSGRRIASALSARTIFMALREEALKLLRGERCLIFKIDESPEGDEAIPVLGESGGGYSREMIDRALASGRAVAFIEGAPENVSESILLSGVRSALCAPVFVRRRHAACLYLTHRQVIGLFGEEEKRVADFLATIAGAALENAEGFAELRRLNVELHQRINEQKQAEVQIQEQAALLDKARDAISVETMEDRILFWNQSAERLYGWTSEETVGRISSDLLFRAPSSARDEAVQAVQAKGEWTGELRQVTKGGREVIVESRWTLVRDAEGKPKSKLVVNTDVTEKKKLEAQFFRSQRMESIGRLAGGVAHDINNVLTPLFLGLDLLKRDLPESQRLALLADLEASAQRGADMVKQILSFARGTEGQRVSVPLKHLIADIDKMLQRTLPKSISIRTSVPSDLWVVTGDPTQLYQLLMNLGVNAGDAMPQGGSLTITAENRMLRDDDARMHVDAKAGPHVLLTVADTGTGIPPEVLDKIFEPFFTTKEYGKGTGLGLATVVGVVKGHGGFVNVTSDVGRGTCFTVYLPATPASTAISTAEAPQNSPTGRGELILLVDDEAPVRQVTKTNLEAHGYRVLTAEDGVEALALFDVHQAKIQAVVTDLMMPRLDGWATIKALRQKKPDLRVIAVSGLTPTAGAVGRQEEPLQALLQKPYSVDKLLRTLVDVLR
jgi:PAS domain S-box-containing protein